MNTDRLYLSMEEMVVACDRFEPRSARDVFNFLGDPRQQGDGIYTTPASALPAVRENIDSSPDMDQLLQNLSMQEAMTLYTGARVLEQARERRTGTHLDALDVSPDQVRVCWGDLTVDGEISNGGVMVVLGDLHAARYNDYDDLPSLIVLGSLRCESCIVGGAAVIAGELNARRLLYGFDHSSCILVGARTETEVLLLDDKTLISREINRRVLIDTREFDCFDPGQWTELRENLVSEVLPALPDPQDEAAWEALEEDELFPLDHEEAMRRIEAGKSLLRTLDVTSTD